MSEIWQSGSSPWTVRSRAEVYRNPWFAVEENSVVRPDGEEAKYQIVRMRKRGVGVLAVEDDGAVHMTGQWRLPIDRYSWELPMGGVEPGETALAAAKRELSEESGIITSNWMALFEIDLSTSLTDEICAVFLAWGLSHGTPHPEPREVIQRVRAPFKEVIARVEQGLIREAATVATLMCAFRWAVGGKLNPNLSQAMLRPVD